MARTRKKKVSQLQSQQPIEPSLLPDVVEEAHNLASIPATSTSPRLNETRTTRSRSKAQRMKLVAPLNPTALPFPNPHINTNITMAQMVIPMTENSKKNLFVIDGSEKKPNNGIDPKILWMFNNTSFLIQTIDLPTITPGPTSISSSAGFELVCTYNWITPSKIKAGPEIYVPGSPPKWSPPALPTKLPADKGHQYVDQNAYRIPQYPFEPIFWALDVMNPSVRFDDVDVVCNRNSLRKLLDLASGRRIDPFVMHLHMLQNTLFITRKEKNARAMIRGNGNSGYGHNFEAAFTEGDEEVMNSSSHHRVVRYNMGGLNCVVRFEVDAYFDREVERVNSNTFDHEMDLEAAMGGLSIGTTATESPVAGQKPKEADKKGKVLPSSKMAEIKTCGKKLKPVSQLIPQMWFGRTPHLLIGRHPAGNGVFNQVIHVHVGSKFEEWEEENQKGLKILVGLLRQIKEIVSGVEKHTAVLMYEKKGGPLKVMKMRNPTQVLPAKSRKYWSPPAGTSTRP
jgi:hypothetical protein